MEPNSGPTAPGASKTPIADPERRRSARVASRVNTQSTGELREGNTQTNTPISQPTKKTKIILNTNPAKSAGKGTQNQAAQNREANMADSTKEPPRKNRRVSGGTSTRHTQGPAGPSQGLNSETSARSLAGGGYSPGAANPALGRQDRSGYSGSPGAAGSSSGQQFTLSGRGSTNTEAQPSHNQSHRVPGMPSTMPRSDTPPPIFDTSNPYSAFSEQPAIPQRRPSTTADRSTTTGRSAILASLPSLPSDEALTNALQGSIQNQANAAQGKLDHRDPNWRHPWGIPVEPLPPTPEPYVYVDPQVRALQATQNASAVQANDEGEEYYGLDEHIPLGDHPLDMEFAQFLFDHHAQENPPANYANNTGGISHDLREFEYFFGSPSPASNPQTTASGVQPTASNAEPIASAVQPAAPIAQPVATGVHHTSSGVQPTASNAQSLARNSQTAAPGMQPGNRAGDVNAFPNYPYGYDVLDADPPITNSTVNKASVGSASKLLNDQAQSLSVHGADAEDVRRTSLAASIMGSLMSEKDKAKGKVPDQQPTQHNYQPQPDFQNLALGKIKLAKVTPVGKPTCTFCIFACDWGVSDDRYRLPEDASTRECQECSNPNTGSFFEEFTTTLMSRDDQASQDALEKALKEPVHAEPVAHHGKKVYSVIDGTEITKFMGPMFCKTSPYGQLDVSKVRMCEAHKNEKFAIIKHHRHKEFRQIGWAMPEDVLSADKVRGMNMNEAEDRVREDVDNHTKHGDNYRENRRCMMCTGYATDVCADCPLRLCVNCVTLLKNICKGYLDNLFYHYECHHLRNDAFLLRSDGGGF